MVLKHILSLLFLLNGFFFPGRVFGKSDAAFKCCVFTDITFISTLLFYTLSFHTFLQRIPAFHTRWSKACRHLVTAFRGKWWRLHLVCNDIYFFTCVPKSKPWLGHSSRSLWQKKLSGNLTARKIAEDHLKSCHGYFHRFRSAFVSCLHAFEIDCIWRKG